MSRYLLVLTIVTWAALARADGDLPEADKQAAATLARAVAIAKDIESASDKAGTAVAVCNRMPEVGEDLPLERRELKAKGCETVRILVEDCEFAAGASTKSLVKAACEEVGVTSGPAAPTFSAAAEAWLIRKCHDDRDGDDCRTVRESCRYYDGWSEQLDRICHGPSRSSGSSGSSGSSSSSSSSSSWVPVELCYSPDEDGGSVEHTCSATELAAKHPDHDKSSMPTASAEESAIYWRKVKERETWNEARGPGAGVEIRTMSFAPSAGQGLYGALVGLRFDDLGWSTPRDDWQGHMSALPRFALTDQIRFDFGAFDGLGFATDMQLRFGVLCSLLHPIGLEVFAGGGGDSVGTHDAAMAGHVPFGGDAFVGARASILSEGHPRVAIEMVAMKRTGRIPNELRGELIVELHRVTVALAMQQYADDVATLGTSYGGTLAIWFP